MRVLRVALTVALALALTFVAMLLTLRALAPDWPAHPPGIAFEPRATPDPVALRDPGNAALVLGGITNVWLDEEKEPVREEIGRLGAFGWVGGSYPRLEAWMAGTSAARDAWDRAGGLPRATWPTLADPLAPLPHLSHALNLARTVPARAESAAARGDWLACERRYADAFANAGHLEAGQTLIEALVASAMDAIVADSMRRLALTQPVPSEVAHVLQAQLRQREERRLPLSRAMRSEWGLGRWCLSVVYTNPAEVISLSTPAEATRKSTRRMVRAANGMGLLALMGSTPARTRQHVDAIYARLVAQADRPPYERDAALDEFRGLRGFAALADDPIGQVLLRVLIPALDQSRARMAENATSLRATALVLAVAQYQREHSTPPASLADLVPGYVAVVPSDPFDPKGGALRYRADGAEWVVYSVGRDGVDHGGRYDRKFDTGHDEESDLLFRSDDLLRAQARLAAP